MENNTVSCKLRIPKDINEKTPVFLVNFPNGNLNLNQANKIKFSCYTHATETKSQTNQPVDSSKKNQNAKRILRAKSVLEYTSKSDEVNSNGKKLKYFVGVRNKISGRMKIYESTSFHLKPNLSNDIITSSEVKSYREKQEELVEEFGSKGMKRSLKDNKKHSADSSSKEEAVKNISINKSVEDANQSPSTSASSNNIDYLPPRNPDARTVDEVYSIIKIISPVEQDYLNNAADELIAYLPDNISQWGKDGTFCDYVLNHLEDGGINNLIASLKVKYLLYFNHLVSFSKLLSYDLKKKDPAQHIPEPIRSCFLDRFTASSRDEHGKIIRSFPQKMKDKLLAYILVVALFIDNYHINLALVQRGTKYGLPKITTIAKALGCHVNRQKVDNSIISTAELKLPLYVYKKYK